MKISFEKFGKNTDFRKSQKKFGQNGWRETSFFYIFSTLGSKGKEGRWDIPRNMKKSENHCTLLYNPKTGTANTQSLSKCYAKRVSANQV